MTTSANRVSAIDPAVGAVQLADEFDRPGRCSDILHQESGDAVIDDLGDAPIRQAITGVPVARLSTATSPNGSCQRSGITMAPDRCR